jgi:dolichol-phosphate mannosyltransferase/undecaprenyl-phosphate 4-deoxy-4-formamido-L-arabinose transferase
MPSFISVVVPVYNSVATLRELDRRLHVVLADIGETYRIIYVDDASPQDETWRLLCELQRESSSTQVIKLMRNFGQQAATLCGMAESDSDYVITIDDDLQHRPEDIPLLLEHRSHDIVIGQFHDKQHSLLKRTASRLKGYFDRVILGKPGNIQLTSYRLLSRPVVEGILSIKTPYPFISAMMLHASRDIKGVRLVHEQRAAGKTGYTSGKLIALFLNLVINNSSVVLRFAGMVGIIAAAFSLVLGIYFMMTKAFMGVPVPGWTSLILFATFGNGLLLFMIGIIGEYLVRIIAGVEQKPVYLIRENIQSGTVDN